MKPRVYPLIYTQKQWKRQKPVLLRNTGFCLFLFRGQGRQGGWAQFAACAGAEVRRHEGAEAWSEAECWSAGMPERWSAGAGCKLLRPGTAGSISGYEVRCFDRPCSKQGGAGTAGGRFVVCSGAVMQSARLGIPPDDA